jgi:Zn-dependent M28 family amino/carboxypeptidase
MERPDVSSTLVWTTLAALGLLAASAFAAPPELHIDGKAILKHIEVLASDDFEGRLPGSPGEEKTVAYLTDQFRRMGLEPGNPDGTYIQGVPLLGYRTESKGSLHVGEKTIDLANADDWVAVTRRQVPEVTIDGSELVFVGYGVVAPEYNWDDYKGQDVRGKTLVMLVGDPPVPDPADPTRLDPKVFGGPAMTYYGRWTYKYEIAAEKGAAAVLVIHEAGPAGYPYEVVKGSWGRENFDIPAADRNAGRAAVEAWIPIETARELFEAAGQDFAALKAGAAGRDFRPVPLKARLDATIRRTQREVKSRNVVAKCVGSDPKLRDEYIIYTAHWDHLGRDDTLSGDPIYNGAADNASGTATLLELARAFAGSSPHPKRSILFLAVTAEEQGLLGAKSYAEHPLYPLEKTLANINMDVINLWGRTSDLTSVGLGQSTLDDLLAEVAGERGRSVGADPEPEKGLYYRSDHFEFAKVGVPALNAKGGMAYVGKPADYGKTRRDEYTRNDYHKPSDQVKPDWDLSGAAEDAGVLYEVGRRIADGDRFPEWKPGSEFRARREAMLQAAGR